MQRMAHPDGELAMARGAAAAGTILTLSTLATATPSEVASAAPGAPRWYQVYVFKDRSITQALVDDAVNAGYEALVVTVDAPVPGHRERDLRVGFSVPQNIDVHAVTLARGISHEPITAQNLLGLIDPTLTWRDLERFVADAPLPVLVKGIQTAADARLAAETGVAGIVVSNHGGRQLDSVPSSVRALPAVVEAVGDRVEVLVDGGVRTGLDVVKLVALGARAVLVGRAWAWAVAARGEAGVRHMLAILKSDIDVALGLTGHTSIGDVDASAIYRGDGLSAATETGP
jgi:isopentenyl diphosphate isomerase/L-lactate dehydrogenase-like FMN-dependent dehydrogenase